MGPRRARRVAVRPRRSRRSWPGGPARRTCGCCWSAGPASGWPTPAAAGPTPTAARARRGCGGRCGPPTPTCSTAPWDGSVGERADAAGLPGLHARRPRRLLRAARPPAGPGAAGAGARRRLGVQPPRRRPVRRQRRRPAARLLLRAGARGRRRSWCGAHERGQVALPWLRGRAGLPPPGQAAQHSARGGAGAARPRRPPGDRGRAADRRPAPRSSAGWSRWPARTGPSWRAVESRPSEAADRLTCRAAHPAHSRTWHVAPGVA